MTTFARTLRTLLPVIVVGPLVIAAGIVSMGILLVRGHLDQGSWVMRLPWMMAISLPLIVPALLWRAFRLDARATEELRENGLAATATVTAVRDPGLEVSGQTMLELAVQVRPPDAPSFEATVMVETTLTTIHEFQPGLELRVRYDANDRARVVVVEQ